MKGMESIGITMTPRDLAAILGVPSMVKKIDRDPL